jgi:hypothetical protein
MWKNLVIAALLICLGVINYNVGTSGGTEAKGTVELSSTHPVENCEELISTYKLLVEKYKERNALQNLKIAAYEKFVDKVDKTLGR